MEARCGLCIIIMVIYVVRRPYHINLTRVPATLVQRLFEHLGNDDNDDDDDDNDDDDDDDDDDDE